MNRKFVHCVLQSRLYMPLQPPNFVGDAPDLVHRKSIDMVSVINARYVQFAEANVGKKGATSHPPYAIRSTGARKVQL